jgi:hypothetical protein
MPASPPDAAAHRRRVLEHLERQDAAQRAAPAESEPQMRMPLIVEVKPSAPTPARRKRRRGRAGGKEQRKLDGL